MQIDPIEQRTSAYLDKVLTDKSGKYTRITKLHGCKLNRRKVFTALTDSLRILGIEFDNPKNTYKIKVLNRENS